MCCRSLVPQLGVEHLLVLRGTHVSELVDSHAEGVLRLCVLSSDLREVALEDLISGVELLLG